MSQFKIKDLVIKDELADILMKSWYSEDPFPGWTTKLLNNRQQFQQFLQSQYGLSSMQIQYKRTLTVTQVPNSTTKEEKKSGIEYPETVDMTQKRYRSFFKSITQQFFESDSDIGPQKARVVICVGHGVPFQNAFLQMFEADKDCVYLDYNAISIVEKEHKPG